MKIKTILTIRQFKYITQDIYATNVPTFSNIGRIGTKYQLTCLYKSDFSSGMKHTKNYNLYQHLQILYSLICITRYKGHFYTFLCNI
jgi:hypothetical protein